MFCKVLAVEAGTAASMLQDDRFMSNTSSGQKAVRTPETESEQESSGALSAFKLYTRAFGALDAGAVARFFHEPALLITPKDVIALPTAATVEQTYAGIMRELPRDYVRTEFRGLSERLVGDDLALVTGNGSWKNASNDDIMPFGMTYTLRRTADTWRIVVVAIHAAGR
jgi:ketosteroid isomerase-like protein